MKLYDTPCTTTPLEQSTVSKLNRRINSVSRKVTKITPYEESKKVYIYDTEAIFNRVKNGVVTVNCTTEDGESIPTTLELTETEIIVRFDALEKCAIVTISIQ